MKSISALFFAAATVASLSAHALTPSDLNGMASPMTSAQRTIVIDANTRFVNVAHGETVHFVNNGVNVTWTFDGIKPVLPLSTLFPTDAALGQIEVYIAPEVVS